MTKLEKIVQYLHMLPKPVRYFFYLLYSFAALTLFMVALPFVIIGIFSAYLYCFVADQFESMNFPK